MLRDLTIQNYRCFEDFYIDGLERVNLFVGNNNSGKTSLLEAIYLLANPNKRDALLEIIDNLTDYYLNNNSFFYSIRHLFFGHKVSKDSKAIIKSDNPKEKVFSISLSYSNTISNHHNLSLPFLDCSEWQRLSITDTGSIYRLGNRSSFINVEDREYIKIDKEPQAKKYTQIERKIDNNILVSINKILYEKVAFMWDTIALTSKEEKIIEALQIIDKSVERISFSSSNNANLIRLKLSDSNEPIPLSSMGEGMYRILTMAISLVTAEDGVLLVDEIETGLHYEAQTDMWRLILETAKELNVQVFATTHSWDCIAAYQEALSQVEDSSIGKLFRLDSKYGKLRAVEYDAEDLDIAVRKGIEVR